MASHIERLSVALTPRLTKYHPHSPHPKQHAGLLIPQREVLFGGAAGGGKSGWLLMAALQYVEEPGYAAILFRRTLPQLEQPGGLIPTSHEWLDETDARWSPSKNRWTFPSGATLSFGFMRDKQSHLNYQGPEYDFIGFDELTQFPENQYRYLFSRLRRRQGSRVPARMRATANPGGPGHDWVKQRFGIYRPTGTGPDARRLHQDPAWVREHDRAFLPSHLSDNPSLDADDYQASLAQLDPTTRQQLLAGDWDATMPGELFRREWFETVDHVPAGCRWVRCWDHASTEVSEENPDPDWTVGLRLGRHPSGVWYVEHVWRKRCRPYATEQATKALAERDGLETSILIEEEPGSSGKSVVQHYQRSVLPGHEVHGEPAGTDKVTKARPVSSKAEAGLVKLVRGDWNHAFLDELDAFTTTDDHAHDDQVDALAGAFRWLSRSSPVTRTSYMPTGQEPVTRRGDLTLRGRKYIDKE